MIIRMPRGDIRPVRFVINNPDKTVTDIDFTEIYFTVKKTGRVRDYKFQKRLTTGGIVKIGSGNYEVRIEPADTNAMEFGNYRFDIQLMFEDELKETFVGDFVLTEEITSEENE